MRESAAEIGKIPKGLKFHPNWSGALPPREPKATLFEKWTASNLLHGKKLAPSDSRRVLRFLDAYENRYFEKVDGVRSKCYHRKCGGGAVQEALSIRSRRIIVYCANCGRLPDLFPPKCIC